MDFSIFTLVIPHLADANGIHVKRGILTHITIVTMPNGIRIVLACAVSVNKIGFCEQYFF